MSVSTNATTNLTYVVNQALSASLDYNGPQVAKEVQTGIFVQAVITASSSVVGALKLQCSTDASTWTDVASSSQSVSGNGSVVWNASPAIYKFWRVVYVHTSGTATLNVSYNMI